MRFEFNYPVTTLEFNKSKELVNQTDILIVTVTEVELTSLLKYLMPIPNKDTIIETIHNGHVYKFGRLGMYQVCHVQSGMGANGYNAALPTLLSAT